MKKKLVLPKRRAVVVDQQKLVETAPIAPDKELGLLITPAVPEVDAVSWAGGHREEIEQHLLQWGAVLLRGFSPIGVDRFEEFIETVSGGPPIRYVYRSTPRSTVKGNVYTTTEYPADHSIPMHNENAYQNRWPRKLFLYCDDAPDEGGATPLSNSARVYDKIDPAIREEFERKQVMYVRNYQPFVDLSWQTVFQTEEKADVEAYCREAGIEYEWKADGVLRTRQVGQSVLAHPVTGAKLWFNQAHLFHVTSMEPGVRDGLLESYGEEGLPRNVYFADGSPIPADYLDQIRRIYDEETVAAPWEVGDIAIVDNMKLAHARQPYKGTRRVLIGMTDLYPEAPAQ